MLVVTWLPTTRAEDRAGMTAAQNHDPQPLLTDVNELVAAHGGHTYREFLRVPALSLGLFAAVPGHDDTQQPHEEDEVYVVLGGRAVLDVRGDRTPVAAGSIAYVPARQPHRFVDITEDLRVVVLFAPPETVRT